MSFFAGMTAGFGKAQGEHNQKIMEFMNQKSQAMASMYGHLADQAQDQDVAAEFAKRAMGWSSANPMVDPKGYKELVKGEKLGLHDIVDQAHQRKVNDYQQSTFGVQPTTGAENTNNSDSGFIPGSVSGQKAPTSSGMPASQPQPAPTAQPQPEPPPASMMGQLDVVPSNLAPQQASQPAPQPQPQAPAQPPAQMTPPPTAQPAHMDMDTFIRQGLPPEPPQYGSLGRTSEAWKQWHEIYNKKMEGTVPTPAIMREAVGADYMYSGFAAPYANLMGKQNAITGRQDAINARLYPYGSKLDPVTHQIVPLTPDQYGEVLKLKIAREQSQITLNAITGQYRQAVAHKDTIMAGTILERLVLQKQSQARLERESAARLGDIDPKTGQPFAGMLVLPDGTMVGSAFQANARPSATEQNKAGAGVSVVQHGQNLMNFANNPNNADLFGRLSGHWEDFVAGTFGTDDPREAGLRADIRSMASLLSPLHGFRSQKAAEEFMTTLRQTNSPEAFASAVQQYMYMAETIYNEGMPTVVGAGGQPVRRTSLTKAPTTTVAPVQSKFRVGQTFSKNGKKYTVKTVLPDGSIEANEVP